jgi:acetyltransferase-like isoleucine patch superfamily enzyme
LRLAEQLLERARGVDGAEHDERDHGGHDEDADARGHAAAERGSRHHGENGEHHLNPSISPTSGIHAAGSLGAVISPPLGADALVPEADRLGALRLARLRIAARGRLDVRGRVTVERGVRLRVAPGARVVLEDGCLLGEGCRIDAEGGTVRIGRGARLGPRCVLVALAGIEVGARCAIGAWAMIGDAEPTYDDPERPTRLQPVRTAPVRVGDGALIGTHAALLPGATVAPGEVVAPYETRAPRSAS